MKEDLICGVAIMWSSDPFVFSFIILAHDNFHKNR